MEIIKSDVIIVGAGGGGLRAAIAVAEKHPELNISLLSKVYPMRSHTVAAEGGAAAVAQAHDTLDNHFDDTVSGGDWLCDQEVVDYFVANSTDEMIRLENWGCPWSRREEASTFYIHYSKHHSNLKTSTVLMNTSVQSFLPKMANVKGLLQLKSKQVLPKHLLQTR